MTVLHKVLAKPVVALTGELQTEVTTRSLEMPLLVAHKLKLEQQALVLAMVESGTRS